MVGVDELDVVELEEVVVVWQTSVPTRRHARSQPCRHRLVVHALRWTAQRALHCRREGVAVVIVATNSERTTTMVRMVPITTAPTPRGKRGEVLGDADVRECGAGATFVPDFAQP